MANTNASKAVSSYVLSMDAETNGLWGKAFAIGAILYSPDGEEVKRFIGRCPIEGDVDPWVKENVLPQMEDIPKNYTSYEELLQAYMDWRKVVRRKEGVTEIVHMGVPVEARLFIDAYEMCIIGPWDGAYPLVDIATLPEIGDSVDAYNVRYGIALDPAEFAGGTHNPLYDAAAAYLAYRHWMGWYAVVSELLLDVRRRYAVVPTKC